MQMRKASIKETGEEISQADWARFDAAVARAKAERDASGRRDANESDAKGIRTGLRAPARSAARPRTEPDDEG